YKMCSFKYPVSISRSVYIFNSIHASAPIFAKLDKVFIPVWLIGYIVMTNSYIVKLGGLTYKIFLFGYPNISLCFIKRNMYYIRSFYWITTNHYNFIAIV